MHATLRKRIQHFEGTIIMQYMQVGVESKIIVSLTAEWVPFSCIVKQHKQYTKKMKMLLLGQFINLLFISSENFLNPVFEMCTTRCHTTVTQKYRTKKLLLMRRWGLETACQSDRHANDNRQTQRRLLSGLLLRLRPPVLGGERKSSMTGKLY